jgi:hypothetical protein
MASKPEKKINEIKLDKLNELFEMAKESERELSAEMRTNILLKSGNHYNKKSSNFVDNLRSTGIVPKEQAKIRITKNHIHRIANAYENNILEHNPSVAVSPFNEEELSDVKAAMLGNSVVEWIKQTNTWPKKRSKFVSDMTTVGETYAKLSYDYDLGPKSFNEDTGAIEPSGQFKIDKFYGFEVKIDPSARDFDEAKWVCIELIVDKIEVIMLLESLGKMEDAAKLRDAKGASYNMFDAQRGTHIKKNGKVILREWFFRQSTKKPNGWYCLNTDDLDIVQAELPLGIFPIYKCGFDDIENSPRSSSIIRVCRPYQVEINRASSKMAEHQVTLGDDKVFIQSGTKLSNGGTHHGIRALKFSGAMPIIQAGRSGEQFLNYIVQNIGEMYQAVDLGELIENKQVTGDPFLMLFESMKRKKKYAKYVEKYERFEVEIFTDALKMAKTYLNENHSIKIVGRQERLNIAEFKGIDDSSFQVKIEPMSGDLETRFGKVLTTIQVLQYAGSSLQPDQVGALIKQLPYGNSKQVFDPLTINYDSITNDILAMDRGLPRSAKQFDDHAYMLNALMNRMRKADFESLPPEVQGLYQQRIGQHEQFISLQKEEVQRQSQGMIPTDGFLTTINASWENPSTGQVERIKVPSASVMWLSQQLAAQGFFTQLNGLQDVANASLITQQLVPQVPQPLMPQA